MTEKKSMGFSFSAIKTEKAMPEIIAVTSGKGGVGKSSISVNLAILLSQLKKRVLLLDADIHLGNIDLILGIRPTHTIADVVSGEMELSEIITRGPAGIDILPASSAINDMIDAEEQVMEKISRAFSLFEHEYDTIIVDTGAGVSNNVLSFVLGADTVLLVVTPDPASIADAYGMIKVIRHTNKTVKIVMIANMVDNMESGENLYKKMKLMVNRFLNSEIIYGGAIPRDSLIARSVKRQRPLAIEHPSSIPMNAIKMVTRRLLRIPKSDGRDRLSFFDRFINNKHMEVEG